MTRAPAIHRRYPADEDGDEPDRSAEEDLVSERWWWSLKHDRVVSDEERGPDHEVLGPYPTREAAADWRRTVDERNEEWKAEDERWAGDDQLDADDDPEASEQP